MTHTPRFTAGLVYWSTRTPDAVAVECGDDRSTWAELAAEVELLADRLVADGTAPGDRIGYLCDNSVDVIRLILAGLAVDAVLVPLNVRLTTPELDWIVGDAGLSAILTDHVFGTKVAELRATRSLRTYWTGPDAPVWAEPLIRPSDVPGPSGRLQRFSLTDDTVAFISYTSGTTGRPKGAMLSHRNAAACAEAFAMTEFLHAGDTSLLVLPLAFTGSLMATWAPAYYAGARFVLHPRFSAAQTLDELSSGRITVFTAVPVVFEQIAALDGFATADLSAIRVAKAGGAPPSARVLKTYSDRGVPIGQGYGMTESTGVGTSLPKSEFESRPGSAGITNFGMELKIVDTAGDEVGHDVVGEIWMRGASVMLGYWNQPEATAETLSPDGWLRTGDLGALDTDGFLTLAGREKDMVLSGGLNVYPGEIERVIALDITVGEVAVVGVPDDRWGEVPVAVIVPRDADGIDPDQILAACKRELADYKVPKQVLVWDEPLPRTMSGKISKAALRRQVDDRLAVR